MKDTSPAFALFHKSSQVKKPKLKKPAILPKKVRRLEMRSGFDSIAQLLDCLFLMAMKKRPKIWYLKGV
jgi:hypothetical protein